MTLNFQKSCKTKFYSFRVGLLLWQLPEVPWKAHIDQYGGGGTRRQKTIFIYLFILGVEGQEGKNVGSFSRSHNVLICVLNQIFFNNSPVEKTVYQILIVCFDVIFAISLEGIIVYWKRLLFDLCGSDQNEHEDEGLKKVRKWANAVFEWSLRSFHLTVQESPLWRGNRSPRTALE